MNLKRCKSTSSSLQKSGALGETRTPDFRPHDAVGNERFRRPSGNANTGDANTMFPSPTRWQVLVACEFSRTVAKAFEAAGHYVLSCDLLDAEEPGNHYKGDVRDVLGDDWDLVIAHPPCTYLSRAGYHWCHKPDSAPGVLPLKGAPRVAAMHEAAAFFRLFLDAAPRVCIENPRPIVHAALPRPTQIIQPWQFGHGETKATGLWLQNLPPLQPTDIVEGREQRVFRMPPSPERWKERSRFFPGVAAAMASQWVPA